MTFLAAIGAAALLAAIAAVVLLWRGIRQRHLTSLLLAAELVIFVAAGYLVLLRFITAM